MTKLLISLRTQLAKGGSERICSASLGKKVSVIGVRFKAPRRVKGVL